jgi:hypothetical protein
LLSRDMGGEGILILEVAYEVGELACLHVIVAGIEAVASGIERIADAIELGGEPALLIVEVAIAAHFGSGGRVVEALDFFHKGVIPSVVTSKEGEEPWGRSFCRGLSIVRMEEEFDDICGFSLLPPCHELHCPISN